MSPDRSRVYVTGSVHTVPGDQGDIATIAYDARTGDELWVASYDGQQHVTDAPHALGVSPDGAMVFVTGIAEATEYGTFAYDAATGAERWRSFDWGGLFGGSVAYAYPWTQPARPCT